MTRFLRRIKIMKKIVKIIKRLNQKRKRLKKKNKRRTIRKTRVIKTRMISISILP